MLVISILLLELEHRLIDCSKVGIVCSFKHIPRIEETFLGEVALEEVELDHPCLLMDEVLEDLWSVLSFASQTHRRVSNTLLILILFKKSIEASSHCLHID